LERLADRAIPTQRLALYSQGFAHNHRLRSIHRKRSGFFLLQDVFVVMYVVLPMKTSSLTQPLLLALIMFVGHSMAWSQCLVYNHSYKYSESGFKSHSGSYSGYIVLGPKQIMQDALTRYPIVTFDVYSDKTGKSFSHYDNTPTDGTPSSGGLLIGLVKQGSSLMLLATEKSAGQNQWDWNPFDEETVSGTASYKNGYGYIASTLSATYSGWFPNYYYYTRVLCS
jgi:hypothetical protein